MAGRRTRTSRELHPDHGVFVCPHVFSRARPVLLVVRDPEGDWQFLCGKDGCVENGECHLVCVGHLVQADASLSRAASLAPGEFIERTRRSARWSAGQLG